MFINFSTGSPLKKQTKERNYMKNLNVNPNLVKNLIQTKHPVQTEQAESDDLNDFIPELVVKKGFNQRSSPPTMNMPSSSNNDSLLEQLEDLNFRNEKKEKIRMCIEQVRDIFKAQKQRDENANEKYNSERDRGHNDDDGEQSRSHQTPHVKKKIFKNESENTDGDGGYDHQYESVPTQYNWQNRMTPESDISSQTEVLGQISQNLYYRQNRNNLDNNNQNHQNQLDLENDVGSQKHLYSNEYQNTNFQVEQQNRGGQEDNPPSGPMHLVSSYQGRKSNYNTAAFARGDIQLSEEDSMQDQIGDQGNQSQLSMEYHSKGSQDPFRSDNPYNHNNNHNKQVNQSPHTPHNNNQNQGHQHHPASPLNSQKFLAQKNELHQEVQKELNYFKLLMTPHGFQISFDQVKFVDIYLQLTVKPNINLPNCLSYSIQWRDVQSYSVVGSIQISNIKEAVMSQPQHFSNTSTSCFTVVYYDFLQINQSDKAELQYLILSTQSQNMVQNYIEAINFLSKNIQDEMFIMFQQNNNQYI